MTTRRFYSSVSLNLLFKFLLETSFQACKIFSSVNLKRTENNSFKQKVHQRLSATIFKAHDNETAAWNKINSFISISCFMFFKAAHFNLRYFSMVRQIISYRNNMEQQTSAWGNEIILILSFNLDVRKWYDHEQGRGRCGWF